LQRFHAALGLSDLALSKATPDPLTDAKGQPALA